MVVSAPGITFQLLDGPQAAAHADELQVLHAEVYADPPYGRTDDAAVFADRFRVQRRQPGFVLAEARHGGYLVGYASGMPLRPSTSWWRDLTTPLPADVTAEHPGRTFALVELLVRASWRRQGIAQTLHDLILANRPEERATLTVLPAATPAQNAFAKWGWRKVARPAIPAPAPRYPTCSSPRSLLAELAASSSPGQVKHGCRPPVRAAKHGWHRHRAAHGIHARPPAPPVDRAGHSAMVAAHRDPLTRRWLRHPITTAEQARQAIGPGRRTGGPERLQLRGAGG